jgi:hypothetical protein
MKVEIGSVEGKDVKALWGSVHLASDIFSYHEAGLS